ncbi:hypothetical protein [Thermoplasma volcanium GSS1]|uniref:Chlorite dismutase n=1 Tax=Thermoplasma volcanium (strain ATCC 51530 / DSM 4299 / JCM 9571 / NBRC 15438 / GSS1) TaxID=273116 RepID=Q97AK5_THEVO|nr:chlorite dismutase family protein [Thermoplasma volcanium]BAB59947.1 hypothetical protein [Thermoplasma volcanium GSS1]
MNEVYTFVTAYKFLNGYVKDIGSVKEPLNKLSSILRDAKSKMINLHTYRSFRYDSDLVFWFSSRTPDDILELKEKIGFTLLPYANATYSSISIYDESPYNAMNKKLEDSLKLKPLDYFVAYPMSKDPEWYLLPFDERKEIMREHIDTALKHPDEKGIRSYTTYSFGIGDQEFVVLYELPDIAAWSRVTEKLREVKARKWIVKETPIILGRLIDLNTLSDGFIN